MTGISSASSAYDLPVQQVALEVQRGDRAAPDLLRALMGWPAWRTPGAHHARGVELGVLTTPEGGRILEVFSSDDAILAFNAANDELLHPQRLTLGGVELFSLLARLPLDSVNIDTFSPHAFKYRSPQQLALLAAWAKIAEVELALLRPADAADPFGVLRRFNNWHLAFWEDPEGRDRVLAPDDRGRNLMALFTAEDTAEAFIQTMQADTGEAGFSVEGGYSGEALFKELARLPLDGIVVNPLGPLPATALAAAALARLVG